MGDASAMHDDRLPSRPPSNEHDEPVGSLETLRTRLEDIDAVPMDERAELFEQANAELASALASLDEV